MFFIIKVQNRFTDKETGNLIERGDLFITPDEARTRDIIKRGLGQLFRIETKKKPKKTGPRDIFYHTYLANIGGIETWAYNIAKTFKNRSIEFLFHGADLEQAFRIGKYCDVQIDDGRTIEADTVVCCSYDSFQMIKGRVNARKIYQMCHADWTELKKVSTVFKNFEWYIDPQIDKVISVSETAQKSLLTAFRKPIESVVVKNIPPQAEKGFRVFLTLSRLTSEKGGKRTVQMIQKFHEAGKDFLWLIASNFNGEIETQLGSDSSVIFIGANLNRVKLLEKVDYLVQLSDNESYCYSAHEALSVGTPVIGTRIPELEKIIKPGKNGYLVKQDLSDLDIKAIFEKKPQTGCLEEPIDPNWDKLLNGEL